MIKVKIAGLRQYSNLMIRKKTYSEFKINVILEKGMQRAAFLGVAAQPSFQCLCSSDPIINSTLECVTEIKS